MKEPDPLTEAFDPRIHRAAADELAGRVIAITGASDGLGREPTAARQHRSAR